MVHARKNFQRFYASLLSTYQQTVATACITANLFSFVYPTQKKYIGTVEGKLNSNDLALIKLIKTRLGSNTKQSTATTELDVFPRGKRDLGPSGVITWIYM